LQRLLILDVDEVKKLWETLVVVFAADGSVAFVLSWCEVAEDWMILQGKVCYSAYIGISRILYRSHNNEQSIQSQRYSSCLCPAFTACTRSTTSQLPLLPMQRQMAQPSAPQAPMSSATPQCAF